MKANIGITDANLKKVSGLLNTLLADEATLYTKTRNYHWNVTGPSFMELHKLLEGQYDEIAEMTDEVAERVRTLGHTALGSQAAFLQATRLKEDDKAPEAMKMLQNLLADHETIVKALRKDIETVDEQCKDAGTADFMTGVMKAHEKMAWMLRAYLA